VAEVAPVHLGLISRQGAQAQIGFSLGCRPVPGDDGAEMAGTSIIPALADHGMQTAGRQRGELLQGLADEGQIGIGFRRPWRLSMARQASLSQNPGHGIVMKMQLTGDRSDAPLLDMVVAQDLRFGIRGDGQCRLLSCLVERCFEEPGGGAENPSGRNPDSSRCTGSNAKLSAPAFLPVHRHPAGRVLRRLPGSRQANHPWAVRVNPDLSLYLRGTCTGVRLERGPYRPSASRRNVYWLRPATAAGPLSRRQANNNGGPGRNACRWQPECGREHSKRTLRTIPPPLQRLSVRRGRWLRMVEYCPRFRAMHG